MNSNQISNDNFSGSIDPEDLATFEPVVYNMYFWQVNDANGNSNYPLTEQLVLEAVANLNIEFNPANIFFKYRGFGELDSPENVLVMIYEDGDGNGTLECVEHPELVDPDGYGILNFCQADNLLEYAQNNDAFVEDAFNVYVPYGTDNFGGLAYSLLKSTTFIPTGNLKKPAFVHEVGHVFSLVHTHNNWINYNTDGTFNEDYDACEHVTRHPDDEEFNAITRGDGIPDTAAVPDFGREYCILNDPTADCSPDGEYRNYWIEGCTYNGFNDDCLGDSFVIYDEDVQNFMAYTLAECRNNFTVGQFIRMREGIIYDPYGEMEAATTDIAALYEPYKGEYYVAGPLEDHYVPPHFQPGFEYRFVECESPLSTPEPYSTSITFPYDINNVLLSVPAEEDNYSLIVHPNHTAIGIVSPGAPNQGFWPRPKKCYDNWNRASSGGSVIKFNDDVLNTNITITSQDSISINNPQLIDNLESGLYKIEKSYDDGSIQETIIYKENNE